MSFEIRRDDYGYAAVYLAGHEVFAPWWVLSDMTDEHLWKLFATSLKQSLETRKDYL